MSISPGLLKDLNRKKRQNQLAKWAKAQKDGSWDRLKECREAVEFREDQLSWAQDELEQIREHGLSAKLIPDAEEGIRIAEQLLKIAREDLALVELELRNRMWTEELPDTERD